MEQNSSMEQGGSIDRIRSATFAIGRKGYDKREVERFLNQLADWLETGGSDEARANTFRRELEKVGERTGAILSAAHDAAEEMREGAQREAKQTLKAVREESELKRTEADGYSHETRASADGYSKKSRAAADDYSAKTRGDSDEYANGIRAAADRDAEEIKNQTRTRAREAIEVAKAEAERIITEGRKRRTDIEAVISDLVGRRDAVLDDVDRLTGELRSAVGGHSESFRDSDEASATEREPVAAEAEPPKAPARARKQASVGGSGAQSGSGTSASGGRSGSGGSASGGRSGPSRAKSGNTGRKKSAKSKQVRS